jgi:tetratricopeptide (TPR) repeat protein/transcriptional regulator with XRE-family HTH domain
MVKKAIHATPNRLLRAARRERGWTQQQVADFIGAPFALYISRWENGTALPSSYYLERLCQLFGKSIHELGLSQLQGEWQGKPPARPAPREQQPVARPPDPRMGTFPTPRNTFFLGREDVLARLHRRLHAGQTMALAQPPALSGLGGVGKTQVALEYAYRHAQEYQAVFWLRADTRDAVVAGFLEIARTLNLPEHDQRDQLIAVAAVKNWFGQHTDWLLILDDADDLAFLPEFLPAPLRGHLLLTTRAQALGGLASRIEVEVLEPETAALLLLRRSGLLALDAPLTQAEPTDVQAAVRLVSELGGLPLALDQAGAYLEETGCGLQQYLDLYRSHRAALLRLRGGVVQDHPDSVATTWSLSFAQVERQSALAADLLRLCAWLHPDTIPEEVFLQGAAHLGPALAVLEKNALAFNQALAVLQRYSLVRRTSREQTISIHRLVQAVLQDAMANEERDRWMARAIAALNAIYPEVRHQGWSQWKTCSRLVLHVLALAAFPAEQTASLALATLLVKTADYLFQRAQYKEAEPLYQRALQMGEKIAGASHLQVAYTLSGLAALYGEQGDYEQAEPLFQRALQLLEQDHGGDQREMAYLLNNLAILYGEQGQFQRAEPLFQRALQLWEHLPDPEHSTLVSALNNLAILYSQQGEFQRAEPLFQRALHLEEQLFGETHPEVTYPLTNLAVLYWEQGRFAEAEPLYQRALRIREQTLGDSHPQVAFPLTGLANLYREQGRFAEAEPLYQRALQIFEQTLGDSHPQVAFALNGLANLYLEQGRYAEAEPLYQRALTIRRQQRGPQHPETAESLFDFARFKERLNQPDQALTFYQQALAIQEQQLGPAHHDTQKTRAHFARLLHDRAGSVAEHGTTVRSAAVIEQAEEPSG